MVRPPLYRMVETLVCDLSYFQEGQSTSNTVILLMEINPAPVDMVNAHYLQGFMPGGAGFLSSTVF